MNSLKRFFHACRPGSHSFTNCLHFGLFFSVFRTRLSSVKPNSFSILSISFLISCCFFLCFESSPKSPPVDIRQRIFESLFCRKCFEIHNDLSIFIKLLPNTYFGKKIKKIVLLSTYRGVYSPVRSLSGVCTLHLSKAQHIKMKLTKIVYDVLLNLYSGEPMFSFFESLRLQCTNHSLFKAAIRAKWNLGDPGPSKHSY